MKTGNHVLIFAAAAMLAACKDRDGDAAAAAEPAGGAITIWTDSTELFMEHPALIVGAPDKFAVHLTDITDFAALRSGRITLRFNPHDGGSPLVVVQDSPRAPGIYGPAPDFKRAGIYDLTLLVNSPQARDSITVPSLRVYASVAEAPKDSGGAETGISFLKEQQWKTPGFRTDFARLGAISASIDAPGQIAATAARQAEVTAPIAGLIDPASAARAPAPGQRVSRGQVLAVIAPSLGEGGSAYAEARAELREASEELARARRLVAAEAAPARRVHEAEIRYQAAREALVGLGGQAGRVPVRTPIGGVVINRSVPGSMVAPGASLFTIVDPSVVWLTVNVPAASASAINLLSTATFTVEGSPRSYAAPRIVSIGSVVDPVSRTVPIIYEVVNPDGSLKIGANARASVRSGGVIEGVVVPTSAILDDNGRPIVFVQVEGETFERREVVLGGRQGELTLIATGVRAGERVVTGAAYQVRLASLSTAVPQHGHEH